MALIRTVTITTFGRDLKFVDAYSRVSRIEGDKGQILATVDTTNGKDGEMLKKESFVFPHDLNGGNAIEQAYLHIKTLPDFSTGKDR